MIGLRFSHYRILEKLGEGGMGEVYKAEDVRLGRLVAIKFLSRQLCEDPLSRERFKRESLTASSLEHPNICTVFDVGELEGRPYITMQYLEGCTLDQLIAQKGLDGEQQLQIGLKVAEALAFAHQRGVLHRDIKPGNILVSTTGEVKILDFGIAKFNDPFGDSSDSSDMATKAYPSAMTVPGIAMGTICYMSPEQALGRKLDQRSDIFSLGVVMYEMATGTLPFRGKTAAAFFNDLLHTEPRAVHTISHAVPAELGTVIQKAISKDLGKRYQSTRDLLVDLRCVNTGQTPVMTGPVLEPAPGKSGENSGAGSFVGRVFRRFNGRSMPTWWTLAAAAVVLVAGAVLNWPASAPTVDCILLDNWSSQSDLVEEEIPLFLIRRALSQFDDFSVLRRSEFARLQAKAGSGNGTAEAKGYGRTLLGGFLGGTLQSIPRVAVSGVVRNGLSGIELVVSKRVAGVLTEQVLVLQSPDDLLSGKLDALVQEIVAAYDNADGRFQGERRREFRPISQLTSSKWDAIRHYWNARKLWPQFQYSLAQRELEVSLEIDPSFAAARLLLGEVLAFQTYWDQARHELNTALGQADALTEEDRLKINTLLARSEGKVFEERESLRRLAGRQAFRPEVLYELAESYFHSGDAAEAITHYQAAIGLDAEFARAWNHLGYCYSWLGNHAAAIHALTRYVELDNSANAYDSLGDGFLHAGLYEQGVEMKRRSVATDATSPYPKRQLAFALTFMGQYREAKELLQGFVREGGDKVDQASFVTGLAFIALRQEKYREAAGLCREGLGLLEKSHTDFTLEELLWVYGLASFYDRNDLQLDKASERLARMVEENELGPGNFRPAYKFSLHLKAAAAALRGSSDEVRSLLQDLEFLGPKLSYWATPFDNALFLTEMARLAEYIGDTSLAERLYREALAFNPNFAWATLRLARICADDGRREESGTLVDRFEEAFTTADPDAPERAFALRLRAALAKGSEKTG